MKNSKMMGATFEQLLLALKLKLEIMSERKQLQADNGDVINIPSQASTTGPLN